MWKLGNSYVHLPIMISNVKEVKTASYLECVKIRSCLCAFAYMMSDIREVRLTTYLEYVKKKNFFLKGLCLCASADIMSDLMEVKIGSCLE